MVCNGPWKLLGIFEMAVYLGPDSAKIQSYILLKASVSVFAGSGPRLRTYMRIWEYYI